MYRVVFTTTFSAAHNLRLYHGKPEPLHGHNWQVQVRLAGDKLDGEDMLVDFVEVERVVTELLKQFDYHYINNVPPFDDLNPTSENLARVLFAQIGEALAEPRVRVEEVTVWETPSCGVSYSE